MDNVKKMTRLLIHVCCAPCFVAPYYKLKNEFEITTLWFNPNIHPVTEYVKRRNCFREFLKNEGINKIEVNEYGLLDFMHNTFTHLSDRCYYCYYNRLHYTAMKAKQEGFDCFSSTLLYSKVQNHELIKKIATEIAEVQKIPFYYQDLRELWKEGITLSKEMNMYRQQYCGCIFSEMDRNIKVLQN